MRYIKSSLILVVLISGCAFNQYQRDTADNQYYEQEMHSDPSAAYVGEWTAATNVGLRSIKIKEDGRIMVCLSPSAGTTEGKVFLDKGQPVFMIRNGAKGRVISVDKEIMLLDLYGKQEKYYAATVPDACSTAFKNFK